MKSLAPPLSFCLAVWVATEIVRWLSPAPLPYGVMEKDRYLRQHQSEIDTLFIGSSRFYTHVIPSEFDQLNRERGVETHSFNFGLDGLRPPESFYYAGQILAGLRLKWVFVELCPIYTPIKSPISENERTIEWHTAANTAIVISSLFREPTPRPDRWQMAGLHLSCFLRRVVRAGAGNLQLQGLIRGPREAPSLPNEWDGQDGFCPNPNPPLSGTRLADFETSVASARMKPLPLPLPPLMRGSIRELIEEIHRSGAAPIFVVTPTLRPDFNFASLREQSIPAELISFADIDRFPELYRPELHTNDDHLIGAGPSLLTRRLAGEFRSHIDPNGAPSSPNQ